MSELFEEAIVKSAIQKSWPGGAGRAGEGRAGGALRGGPGGFKAPQRPYERSAGRPELCEARRRKQGHAKLRHLQIQKLKAQSLSATAKRKPCEPYFHIEHNESRGRAELRTKEEVESSSGSIEPLGAMHFDPFRSISLRNEPQEQGEEDQEPMVTKVSSSQDRPKEAL